MKGKDIFTSAEISQIEELISKRTKASPSDQKKIRDELRVLGFYGRDDFGIIDMTLDKFHELIKSGRIIISDSTQPSAS